MVTTSSGIWIIREDLHLLRYLSIEHSHENWCIRSRSLRMLVIWILEFVHQVPGTLFLLFYYMHYLTSKLNHWLLLSCSILEAFRGFIRLTMTTYSSSDWKISFSCQSMNKSLVWIGLRFPNAMAMPSFVLNLIFFFFFLWAVRLANLYL